MIDSGWLSWFNFTKCFVYGIVCAVGVWGEGLVGEGERVGLNYAHIAHWCLRRNHRQGKQKQ